jgi:hypothetical protein
LTPQSHPRRLHRLARWERLGLGVRLAYNPRRPDLARSWVDIGLRLVDTGVAPELPLLRRMLRLLLQVAHDEAVPWYLRSVCLELTARPVQRLVRLMDLHDPPQAEALRALVDVSRARLDAVPAASRHAFGGAS